MSKDYEVGYGRPPVATRFKPGQCGNPKRIRKRRPRTFADVVEEAVSERVWITEGGVRKRVSLKELISSQLGLESAKGNGRALQMFLTLRDDVEKNGDLKPQVIRLDKCWEGFGKLD